MPKDDKRRGGKDPRIDVGAKPSLAHNPFAALAARTPDAARSESDARSRTTEAQPPSRTTEAQPPSRTTEAQPPSRVEPASTPAKKLGRVTLRRETKHRGGKAVVIVTGFGTTSPLDRAEVTALAGDLKRVLGCGGTVEPNGAELQIVIQGDQPARVTELLVARGFKVGGVTK